MARIEEIAPDLFRISIYVPQIDFQRLRMIVPGKRGDTEQVIAAYGLEHGGTMSR